MKKSESMNESATIDDGLEDKKRYRPEPMGLSTLRKAWQILQVKFSLNIGALFVAQTLLRKNDSSQVYVLSPKFAAGNMRPLDIERVFDPESESNSGILGTLLGVGATACRLLSIYALGYMVWPFLHLCVPTGGNAYTIPVRTPFTHAQKAPGVVEPDEMHTSKIEIKHAKKLIDLLNAVSEMIL
jgi:hypothetical protein